MLLVSVHECVDYCRHVETLEVGVLLAHAHKQDRLACCLDHVDAGADLLVHGVNAETKARLAGQGLQK